MKRLGLMALLGLGLIAAPAAAFAHGPRGYGGHVRVRVHPHAVPAPVVRHYNAPVVRHYQHGRPYVARWTYAPGWHWVAPHWAWNGYTWVWQSGRWVP